MLESFRPPRINPALDLQGLWRPQHLSARLPAPTLQGARRKCYYPTNIPAADCGAHTLTFVSENSTSSALFALRAAAAVRADAAPATHFALLALAARRILCTVSAGGNAGRWRSLHTLCTACKSGCAGRCSSRRTHCNPRAGGRRADVAPTPTE